MFMKYNKFIYKFGIRNIETFLSPKVLEFNTIVLPYYSMLHIFNPNSDHYINSKHYFLEFTKKKFIFNPMEYTNPIYKEYREKSYNYNSVISKLHKDNPDIKILNKHKFFKYLENRPNDLKYTIPIINYNQIHNKYVYKYSIKEYYYKFKNAFNSLIENIIVYDKLTKRKGKNDIAHFVILEVPDILYSYTIYNKYMRYEEPTIDMLKLFYDTSRLIMLEFFKLLDDKLTKASLFYKLIEAKISDRVVLVLNRGDTGVMLPLSMLYSFLKISDIKNSTKLDSDRVKKLYFFLLRTIIMSSTLEDLDVDDKIVRTIDKSNIDNSNINVDDLLKNMEASVDNDEDVVDVNDIIKKDEDTVEAKTTPLPYDNKYSKINNIKDLTKPVEEPIQSSVIEELNELANNKKLDKPKYKKLVDILQSTLNKPSPYKDGKKLKDYITIDKKDLEINKDDVKLDKSKVVIDDEEAEDTIAAINKKYLNKVYKKDLIRSILGIQKSGLIVKNIDVEDVSDTLGGYENYSIEVSDLGKSSYTIKVKLPKIGEDGRITISGNNYQLRTQKADKIIKKINYNRVALSTAYSKLFIDRAPYKKLELGYSIKKQLTKMLEVNKISNFVSGSINIMDVDIPKLYGALSKHVKSFIYNDYIFNFNYYNRKDFLNIKDDKDLEAIEQNKYIVCGKTKKNDILLTDKNDIIYLYKNKKLTKLGTIIDILDLDTASLKHEYSLVKIHKIYISSALLLSYYMGLTNLLKKIDVKYDILDSPRAKVTDKDAIVLRFKFNTLVIYPKDDLSNIILSGFDYEAKVLKKIDLSVLDNKELFKTIFNNLGYNLLTANEIELMEKLYVDPVSYSTLELMSEPTTFIGLIVRANELLLNDYYPHPNSMKGFLLKKYERIPQFIYKTMVDSIRKKKNEEYFGRSRLAVNPYEVWNMVNSDGAIVLEDDLNPIANLKQKEDTTLLGIGGRTKESLNSITRGVHKDDIGVISESSKDSADVGITAYMSANPIIKNLRGEVGDKKDLKPVNILSTSSMLAPFSMHDDIKRSAWSPLSEMIVDQQD